MKSLVKLALYDLFTWSFSKVFIGLISIAKSWTVLCCSVSLIFYDIQYFLSMTILAQSRQHSKRSTLSGFLALLFLAQALLLPWLTAPKLVASANGQWAMLCTLQGLQRVYVKTGDPAPLNTKGNHCPACTLAHDVNVPLPVISLAVLLSPLLFSSNVVYEEHVVLKFELGNPAIRAPPLA